MSNRMLKYFNRHIRKQCEYECILSQVLNGCGAKRELYIVLVCTIASPQILQC